nr:MAG TPA: hypothetical protein [Bacteriophage sp.]
MIEPLVQIYIVMWLNKVLLIVIILTLTIS